MSLTQSDQSEATKQQKFSGLRLIVSSPTKFEPNPINGLSANAQKPQKHDRQTDKQTRPFLYPSSGSVGEWNE